MKRKNMYNMTRREFLRVPRRKWNNEPIGLFYSLVIIPGRKKDLHYSGHRYMDFVACDERGYPIKRFSSRGDVFNMINVIKTSENKDFAVGWSVDCLPKSGLLRLFPQFGGAMKCDIGSTVYAIRKEIKYESI